jgi:hypothetical protein
VESNNTLRKKEIQRRAAEVQRKEKPRQVQFVSVR